MSSTKGYTRYRPMIPVATGRNVVTAFRQTGRHAVTAFR
jgi:hypothetical protein